MADIRIISTGRTFKQIDGTLAAVLLELFPANVERVSEQPPAPVSQEARWFVGKNLMTEKVQLMFQQGSEEQWYDGPAEHAHRAFGKRQVPPAVIDEYKLALENEKQKDNARRRPI